MEYYVGIDIGGTDIKYGLLNRVGEIIHKEKIPTKKNGEALYQDLLGIIQDYCQQYEINGVGISAPGIIEEDGYMRTAGAIHDFYETNLKERLEKDSSLSIFVENDANCVALAEKWLGVGQDYHHFLSVVVGTGIGGGLVINDRLFRGGHATAGEFGFMVMNPIVNNDTRSSTLSLTGSVYGGLIRPYYEKDKDFVGINGKKVYELVEKEDSFAEEVVQEFYHTLAKGIFNMIVSFDPEAVLIGGAISTNQKFMEGLTDEIKKIKDGHPDMNNVILPPVIPCKFLNDAGIIGAVYGAITMNKGENK